MNWELAALIGFKKIRKLALDAAFNPSVPVFRIQDIANTIFVTEPLRDAILAANCTGIVLKPIEEYRKGIF